MNSKLLKLLNFALLLLPAAAFAGEASEVLSTPKSLSLTHAYPVVEQLTDQIRCTKPSGIHKLAFAALSCACT